jgi:hypothetical protein
MIASSRAILVLIRQCTKEILKEIDKANIHGIAIDEIQSRAQAIFQLSDGFLEIMRSEADHEET